MDKQLREEIRELLHKFEVDEGYYEFTDSGVWVTDKAVDAVKALIEQNIKETEGRVSVEILSRFKDWADGVETTYNEFLKTELDRIKSLQGGNDE